MPKRATELGALQVSRLKSPGNHAVGGVNGLYLYINNGEGKSWILRTMVGGRRRHMGLGSYPEIGVAQARDRARAARELILKGCDPIVQRQQTAEALRLQQAERPTFAKIAEAFIAANEIVWRNAKHRAQWSSTLETYAYPVIGDLPVSEISEIEVLAVLEPIWPTKNETASRLRGRIENVLDWARFRGYREGDNPARWRGHLDKVLPAPSRVKTVKHFSAIPANAIAEFVRRLSQRPGMAPLALHFLILTAARSGEVRGATWDEVDREHKVWIIPADRMKARREHRVPLSEAALAVIDSAATCAKDLGVNSQYVFFSHKGGRLSDMALTAVMRRMDISAVPHGFRSTFRDWVGEMTEFPSELAEQALAHALANKTEAAYRRGDALEKRRELMEAWARHCNQG